MLAHGEAHGADAQPVDLVEVEFGREEPVGDATLLSCPDCGGVLLERKENGLVRFACQVGHAYSPESLNEHQSEALEHALWGAIRTLEERADLLNRMARRSDRTGSRRTGANLTVKADQARVHADEIRSTLLRLRGNEAETAVTVETPS